MNLIAATHAAAIALEAEAAELRELLTTDWKSLAIDPDEAVASASVNDDRGYLMSALTARGRVKVRELRRAWRGRRWRAFARGLLRGPRYVVALETVRDVAGRAALAVMLDG